MSNLITVSGLKNALSQFLNNLISWLPVKGFTVNGKSKSDTLEVQNEGEIAMGAYNVSSNDTVLSVGNGTNESRKNAFEVKKDGSIYFQAGDKSVKLQEAIRETESIPVDEVNKLN